MQARRAEQIASELEELILNGAFTDGDRLDEVRLAGRFGVSRTPLREALHRLSLSGLVELLPRRGAFVRQPGPLALMEMFEVMAELEASCARLAALRISDQGLAALNDANAKCRAALDAGQPDRYYEENELFHKMIYEQCGNGFLQQEALRLHRRLKPFHRMQLRPRGRMKESMAEHEAIMEALAAGDADRAAHAIRGHVAIQGGKFQHLIKSLNTPKA